MVAPMFVVYRIATTRAADVLVALLGDVFAGVLCRNRWRPYPTYHRGALQFCWAHFKRNVLGALDPRLCRLQAIESVRCFSERYNSKQGFADVRSTVTLPVTHRRLGVKPPAGCAEFIANRWPLGQTQ